MKTMLFERVGETVVLVHSHESPSDTEWEAYLEFVRATVQSGTQLITGLLVTTFGGSPNAVQRKAVLTAAGPTTIATCICSDSSVVRGAITAIRWLSDVPIHALPLRDIDAALQLLSVPVQKQPEVKAVVARLQAQLRQ